MEDEMAAASLGPMEVRKEADKVFDLRSKKGSVMHVVREQYVRGDWRCRIAECAVCGGTDAHPLQAAFPTLARRIHAPPAAPIVLIPDFGVVADYTQLFAAFPAIFDNAVVPASALVRLQDIGYTRTLEDVRALTADARRAIIVFPDHTTLPLATAVHAARGTAHAGVAAAVGLASFYAAHAALSIPDARLSIVVLSNSAADLPAPPALPPSVSLLSTAHYLAALRPGGALAAAGAVFPPDEVDKAALLNDSLDELVAERAAAAAAGSGPGGDAMFEPHVADAVVAAGLKSGELLRGRITVSRRNRRAVFAVVAATGDKVFLPSLKALNRAIADDDVAVALLPRSAWEVPPNTLRNGRGAGSDPQVGPASAPEPAADGAPPPGAVPTGKVVAIVHRRISAPFIATLPPLADGALMPSSVLAVPMDIRLPKVRISSSRLSTLFGQRLLVSLDEWRISSAYPSGHVVRALGAVGDAGVEMEALLLANTIVVEPFSASALAELPDHVIGDPWPIPPDELAARRDLRGTRRVASIDPPGSRDVDDALSIYEVTDGEHAGCIEFGVHIADVTHFVREGSVLDAEARQRGTTVYLADRRFDMLPALLSEDLCSLRGGVDRLAVSVLFTIDVANGFAVKDTWFGRTVIASSYQLEYGQAQALFDAGASDPAVAALPPFADTPPAALAVVESDIGLLVAFGRALKESRRVRGALELHSDEVRVKFEAGAAGTAGAGAAVVGLQAKVQLEMMDIVAEFMIAANEAVAKRVYDAFPDMALLRRHPLPRNEAFEDLVRVAALRGYELDTRSNKALAASLSASMVGDTDTLLLLRQLATTAMSEAVYFSTGSETEDAFYHYGLAAAYYTHFTSPIRRYADVVVHRELLAAVGDGPPVASLSNRSLALLTDHLNDRNRCAKAAQRDSVDLFRNLFFKLHGPVAASGVVYSFFDNGFEVYVPQYGLRAPVFVSRPELDGRTHAWLATAFAPSASLAVAFDDGSMTVEADGVVAASLGLFDKVEVSISGSDAMARVGGISVELVDVGESASASASTGTGGGAARTDFRALLGSSAKTASVVASGADASLGSGARRTAALARARAECRAECGHDGRTAHNSWYVSFIAATAAAGGAGSEQADASCARAKAARAGPTVWARGRRSFGGSALEASPS